MWNGNYLLIFIIIFKQNSLGAMAFYYYYFNGEFIVLPSPLNEGNWGLSSAQAASSAF